MIEKFIHAGIIDPEHIDTLKQYVEEDDKKRIIFLDTTFILPTSAENVVDNFNNNHIPSALFFNIKDIADKKSSLPHMLPDKKSFENSLSRLGIENNDIVILYGQHGMIMGPARVWWMFKGFGHHNVMVLNGGLPAWTQAGYETTSGTPPAPIKSGYKALEFQTSMLINILGLMEISENKTCPIIDARPQARFSGASPEPRQGMRSGHIPNSMNLPCSSLVSENGRFKDAKSITALFKAIGITLEDQSKNRIIVTCGSGITACTLALALHHIDYNGDVSVYDGSWSEWGLESSPTRISN
ncbi:MAG: hypothetical protein COA45_10085 [Zetaproteobacteria bacterium]|nr:MAG: hypothetical protein COA45_10085 [Zetaproteobacteria bacterium]